MARRRTRNMKLKAASPWAVTASADDVDAFADQWPGSGMHGKPGFTAYFAANGDLVDLSGWAANFNGDQSALKALIDDMQAWGETAVADAIGRAPGRRSKAEREVIGLLTGRSSNPRRRTRRKNPGWDGGPSEQDITDQFEYLAGSVDKAFQISNLAVKAGQRASGSKHSGYPKSAATFLRQMGEDYRMPKKAIEFYIKHFMGSRA